MVEEDSDNGIRWNETGDSIIISDLKIFSEQTLFKVYKNPNYTSFSRQLNLYGFSKLNRSYTRPTEKGKEDTEPKEFYNELFCRGRKDLLCRIKRKPRNQKYVANNASPTSSGKRRRSSDVDDYGYGEEECCNGELMPATSADLEETVNGLAKRNQALTCIVSSLELELKHYKGKCRSLEERPSFAFQLPPFPPSSLSSPPINPSPLHINTTRYSYTQPYEPFYNSAPPVHVNERIDYFPDAIASAAYSEDAGRRKERKSVDSEYISVLEVDEKK